MIPPPDGLALPWVLAAAGTDLLLIGRIAVAAALLPLLYLVLRREGQSFREDLPRRLLFAVMGAVVFIGATQRLEPDREVGPSSQGAGWRRFMSGSLQFRWSFIPAMRDSLSQRDQPTEPAEELAAGADLMDGNAYCARYAGLALVHAGRLERGREYLGRSVALLQRQTPTRAAEERALWDDLYGPMPPSPGQLRDAEAAMARLELGWIGRVGLAAAYRRGGSEPPKTLSERIRSEATTFFVTTLIAGFGGSMGIPQLALIVVVCLALLHRTGALRSDPKALHPIAPYLWESFILMMALVQCAQFLPVRAMLGSSQPAPQAVAFILVAQDLIYVLALGYLWWRLRSQGLGLREIGLTAEGFWPNVGIGLAGAAVIMTAGVAVGMLTEQLSRKLFPSVSEPFHPLQGMVAFSGSPLIRAALLASAAVGAPLFEEIFFRGVLYGAVRRRAGVVAALATSSAIFAALHPQLPLGFLPLMTMGLGFSLLYEWRRSLLPAIVAHACNNGFIVLMLNLVFPIGR